MNITASTIVRDRGQITLPYSIRENSSWLAVNSPIQITAYLDEITIRPPQKSPPHSWDTIWDALHLAQSFKGNKGSLSDFILKDRQSH